MEIYIVRHGETDWNKLFLIQGRNNNPLNNIGKSQAKKLGKYFKENNIVFDYIYSSPLLRAIQTAEIIAYELDYNDKIYLNQNFIERDFGELDGQSIDDESLFIMHNDLLKFGEKNELLEKRVFKGLHELTTKYNNERILVVSHSHTLKAILTQLNDNLDYKTKLSNTCINIINYQNEQYKLVKYNISDHLK